MTYRRKEVIGDCTLYLGDGREVLPAVDTADAIVTDPPYAIPTQVASGRSVTRNVGDLSVVELAFSQYAEQWKNCLGETGRIFVFGDGASYPVMFRAAYNRFMLASLVWDKGRIGMGREFRKRHELILHGWGARTPVTPADGTGYADVIHASPVPRSERQHPAEKPTSLIGHLLRVCGPVVADPFMGSGSTGVACVQSGRSFVGVEIDEDYFDMACRRIREAYERADMPRETAS